MRIGVVGFEPQCPGEVCLYSASGLEAAKWDIAAIHERGQDVLVRFPYDRSDEDWRELVEIAAPYASHFELGNEPEDWPAYFKRVPTLARIVRDSGRQAILAAARSEHTKRYLAAAAEARLFDYNHAGPVHVDAVALHPYAASPRESLEIVEGAGELVPRCLPFEITEIGWSVNSGTTTGRAKRFVTTEHDQAEKLSSVFRLFAENAERLKLETALWFEAKDRPQPGPWWHSNGLVRLDGSKRPAFHALETATKERVA